jgi:histidinol dehydrogenase
MGKMFDIYNKSHAAELLAKLRARAEGDAVGAAAAVAPIIADVRARGDKALAEYTEKFDKVRLTSLYLDRAEIIAAKTRLEPALLAAMQRAAANIRAFHEKQKERGWAEFFDGKLMGQRILPLRRVGVYVPGGTAAYPSTVLMNCIPAKVAGVEEIVLATPPKLRADGTVSVNDAVLAAAALAGVDRILTVGGAQAIAALAYGTESVTRVDKIAGPGNIYVAAAKKLVWGAVDIDMVAGPSEVLVIADETANPRFVAADLLSQAEHDPMAAPILVTTSESVARAVIAEINLQLAKLTRRDIAEKSVSANGAALVVDTLAEAAAFSDEVAPEHLELAVADPHSLLGLVRNAGSVFLGAYTPEPLGDYYAGPNHVLPTGGTARFSSALSVDSFVKRSTFLSYDRAAFTAAADDVIRFAEAEGLGAHANSVRVRISGENL